MSPPEEERIGFITKQMEKWKAENIKFQKFLAIYDNAAPDPEKIEIKMQKYDEALRNHEQLLEELTSLDPDYEHHSMQISYEVENGYLDNIAHYEKLKAIHRGDIPASSRVQSIIGSDNSTTRRRLKLPESTLPTFDGDYQYYLSFMGEFDSMIDKRDDISEVDKLTYFRRALTGPAYDKIQMLPITSENYARARKLIEESYSNKRLIISRHIRLLLQIPKQESETAKGLFKLVDDTRQHIEMLKIMGVSVSEEMIVIILENALHRLTADEWDKTLGKNEFPKLDDLLEFLSHKGARLASREINKTDSSVVSMSNNQSIDKKGSKRTYARAFLTSTERTEKECPVCNKEVHPLFKCEHFKSFSAPQRLQTVKEQAYCFNCLRNNHRSIDCYSMASCRLCSGRHNTLLHASFTSKKIERNEKAKSDNINTDESQDKNSSI